MAQTVVIFIVLALVFAVLPAVMKRLTGRDFIELLVGRPLFGKRGGAKNEGTGKAGAGTGTGTAADKAGAGGTGTGAGRSGGKGAPDQKEKREKNSSRSDILQAISDITAFARRNQYYAIIPGVLKKGDLETMLPAILVMRSGVVGINLFGYGGSISAKKDDPEWTQTMNGETRQIPSPVRVSEEARKTLEQILREIGYGEVETAVVSAFTRKDVKITGPMASEVILSKDLTGELGKKRYVQTKGVDVKKLGEALAVYQVHAKAKEL